MELITVLRSNRIHPSGRLGASVEASGAQNAGWLAAGEPNGMRMTSASPDLASNSKVTSGSTIHLLPGVVCRRWSEHVRPEVVPADARCGLDCDATIRGHCTPCLPFADRGGFDAKDFGQALLRADRADSSVDGGLGVHASHLRSNLIYGQQGKPNFISGIVR